MSKKDPRLFRTIRALRGSDAHGTSKSEVAAPDKAKQVDDADESLEKLEDAIASLEAKLASGAGIDGLANWLREVEATVTALEDSGLDQTRDEIRGVINRLLGINAEIQNVVRLKKLLS
jgi:hypothetical protein